MNARSILESVIHAASLTALTSLALTAFAANSLLNRAALATGEIDPGAFTIIRVVSGAAMLAALVLASQGDAKLWRAGSLGSAAALLGYAVCFSYAYVTLEAGIGALLLFAAVQLTMLTAGVAGGERPSIARWAGIAIAFAGFVWLVSPGTTAPEPIGAALMLVAGIAWGIYSLRGRGGGASAVSPLRATGGNFLLAAPASLALLALVDWTVPMTAAGVGLAVASGAIASGLGYAVWYTALRHLEATVAAVSQLLVPLIALAASVAFMGEIMTLRAGIACALILGGVALAIRGGSKRAATR